MRAPFQVLVIPFHRIKESIQYAIFKRRDSGHWQFISGGGEDGESTLDAARRESFEEASIPVGSSFIGLDSVASLPVEAVVGRFLWGEDVYVIKEHSFGVQVASQELPLSSEHCDYRWAAYDAAMDLLKWDSNRTALWELDRRLAKQKKGGTL